MSLEQNLPVKIAHVAWNIQDICFVHFRLSQLASRPQEKMFWKKKWSEHLRIFFPRVLCQKIGLARFRVAVLSFYLVVLSTFHTFHTSRQQPTYFSLKTFLQLYHHYHHSWKLLKNLRKQHFHVFNPPGRARQDKTETMFLQMLECSNSRKHCWALRTPQGSRVHHSQPLQRRSSRWISHLSLHSGPCSPQQMKGLQNPPVCGLLWYPKLAGFTWHVPTLAT